jgi:TPR repeat-containing protein TP_0123
MFCVCLKFPYEHQIKKINSQLIPVFLKSIEVIAKDNGCKKIVKKDSYFYFFDNPISSPFFTLRFLHLLSLSLKKVSNGIHESSVIVEYFPNEGQIECLNELQNINLNFNSILIGSNANKYFKNYALLNDTKACSLKVCTSFTFFENSNKEDIHNGLEKASLFFRKDQNYVQVLYNFILSHPISDLNVEQILKQEAKTYSETRCVLSFYSQNRFNSSFPKYFVDAFIIHAKLYIKVYKKLHNIKQITIYTDCVEKNAEVEKLKQILREIMIVAFPKEKFEIEKIPNDLLELIYILIFASRFIFHNELEDFFFEITETKAFLDVMKIMYEKGIILQKDCIFSYQEEAIKKLEEKLKDKKDYFASFISKYIWKKYKNAEIVCDFNLKNILDLLKSQYNIAFNIDVFFNLKKHYMLLKSEESNVSFENVDVLKKYENIIKFRDKGKFNEAFALTKELNSYFHNERILSGEYRSCSLLGFLFFESNNIGDALTYFSYSLEIAKKTKNVQFICEALCYLSMVYFLQKDFQNCSLTLQELSNSISLFFMQEWKVFYLFIQGRLFIELGDAKKASTAFKLAKDFSSLYFVHLEKTCDIWYGRTLLYEGKTEKGEQILKSHKDVQTAIFLLEAFLLFSKEEYFDIAELKENYDSIPSSSQFGIFPFFEDIAWYRIYKQPTTTRLFEAFYSYYMVMFSSEIKKTEKEKYLKKLEEIAMTSLYSKDNNASIYLYLSYIAQCKIDGDVTGKALGFLSKACNIMQKNTSLMYETSMRDKFMKGNLWNARLFEAATENKLI